LPVAVAAVVVVGSLVLVDQIKELLEQLEPHTVATDKAKVVETEPGEGEAAAANWVVQVDL
jgi:hypothetical protein